jgi:hypothetical protein
MESAYRHNTPLDHHGCGLTIAQTETVDAERALFYAASLAWLALVWLRTSGSSTMPFHSGRGLVRSPTKFFCPSGLRGQSLFGLCRQALRMNRVKVSSVLASKSCEVLGLKVPARASIAGGHTHVRSQSFGEKAATSC